MRPVNGRWEGLVADEVAAPLLLAMGARGATCMPGTPSSWPWASLTGSGWGQWVSVSPPRLCSPWLGAHPLPHLAVCLPFISFWRGSLTVQEGTWRLALQAGRARGPADPEGLGWSGWVMGKRLVPECRACPICCAWRAPLIPQALQKVSHGARVGAHSVPCCIPGTI